MQAIWKYELKLENVQDVVMSKGAKVISCMAQYGNPCLWVINTNVSSTEQEVRRFAIYGTGHEHENIVGGWYISTFQMNEGRLVFHVFELKEPSL